MYILSYAGGEEQVIDSARIENHAFTIQEAIPIRSAPSSTMGRDADGVQISASDFILEAGDLVVKKTGRRNLPAGRNSQNDLYNDLPRRMADIESQHPPGAPSRRGPRQPATRHRAGKPQRSG